MVPLSVRSILASSHWLGSNLSCSILRQEGGADVFSEVRRSQNDPDESSDEMDKDRDSEHLYAIGYDELFHKIFKTLATFLLHYLCCDEGVRSTTVLTNGAIPKNNACTSP